MRKVRNMKKFGFVALSALVFALLSCEQGLGKKVDISIPKVEITNLDAKQSVGEQFGLEGIATDDFDIREVKITLKDKNDEIVSEWLFKNGTCTKIAADGTSSDLEKDTDFTWEGSSGKYDWTLKDVTLPKSGEYKINAYATDTSGYGSATLSTSQKSVVYDKEPPSVKITAPAKRQDSLAKIKTLLDKKTSYQEYSMLENYINRSFKISGTTQENFSLKYIKVWLMGVDAGGEEHVIWKSKVLLSKENEQYKKDFKRDSIENGVWSGDGENDVANNAFQVVPSLRSWSVEVPDLSDFSPKGGPNTLWGGLIKDKTYLKIVTMSSDEAGNLDAKENPDDPNYVEPDPNNPSGVTNPKVQVVNQGWFCYWPESDTPWFEITLGETDATPYSCYPGTNLQGYSYDDDGIEEVVASIWKKTATGYNSTPDKNEMLYKATDDDASTYQTWALTAPTADGNYKVSITVTDINGEESVTKEGYFKVQDVNSPQVKVISPLQNVTLFGDENGDITFELEADDDSGVSKLACVYLKKDSDTAFYLNPTDSRWNKVDASYTVAAKKTDTNGNLLWNVPLKKEGTTSSAGNTRQKYSGTLKLNLFSDLGIDGKTSKLGGQHFIFFVSDGSNALSLDYAIQGDIEAPTATIDEMTVGSEKYTFKDGMLYDKNDNQITSLSNLTSGTEITLKGTWNDDSMKVWGNNIDRLSKFNISWATSNNTTKLHELPTFTTTYNATTETNDWTVSLKYDGNYTGSAIALMAEISDFAGNTKVAKGSFAVTTQFPVLNSITADNPDGYYGAEEEITILMKFNKAIYVTGGTPTLTLNNGDEARFDSTSSGQSSLKFTYTTEEGKDTTRLNVTAINKNGARFSDSSTSGGLEPGVELTAIPGKNLGDNKKISIVTTAPRLEETKLSDDGKKLTLTFSADITKNTGNIEITQTDATLKKVSPILTEAEFRKWNNLDDALDLSEYYTKGTNGADEDGVADLSTKYILNYDKSPNDTDLLASYKKANLHKVTMSIKSSKAKITENKLELSLDGSFALPCKGSSYTVKIPADLVTNIVGTGNPAPTSPTVKFLGVEPPVIRILKSKAKFDATEKTATQPLQSKMKIDCETEGATITYGTAEKKFVYTADAAKMELESGGSPAPYPVKGGVDTEVSTFVKYTTERQIGTNDWKEGQKIFIQAKATPPTGFGTEEISAYEMAYRSVFVFDEEDEDYGAGTEGEIILKDLEKDPDDLSQNRTDGGVPGVWLRGGDSEVGPVTTAGFPLSWNESDYSGAALLTKDSTADSGKWYYVTWDLTTTAYLGVMAGIADASSGTDGPAEWSYGKNSWVPFKKWYCLYPGESRYVKAKSYGKEGWILGAQRGGFGFRKNTTDRDGEVHYYSASGSGGGGGNEPTYEEFESEEHIFDVSVSAGDYVEFSFNLKGCNNFKKLTITLTNEASGYTYTSEQSYYNVSDGVYYCSTTVNMDVDNLVFKCVASDPYGALKQSEYDAISVSDISDLTVKHITEIYSGPPVAVSWYPVPKIDKEVFASVEEGTLVIITATIESGGQVQLDNGLTESSTIVGNEATYKHTLTADQANNLKANGLECRGEKATITSIKIAN